MRIGYHKFLFFSLSNWVSVFYRLLQDRLIKINLKIFIRCGGTVDALDLGSSVIRHAVQVRSPLLTC